jgi:hypothetical protein
VFYTWIPLSINLMVWIVHIHHVFWNLHHRSILKYELSRHILVTQTRQIYGSSNTEAFQHAEKED